ncbi:unnamed protein product, partial [Durusdinium trenchii]
PEATHDEPSLLRSSPSRLLMAGATSTLTAGAAVLPPRSQGPEQTPLLRDTRRSREAEQVQQRLVLEFMSIVGLCKVWLVILLVLMLAACVTVTVLFVQAIIATLFNQGKPCDEPLKYYMVATLLWSQVQSWILSCVRRQLVDRGPFTSMLVSIALSIPGWGILAYGVYMIQRAQSCPKTNPNLFFPLQRFVYAQIAVALITCLLTVLGFFSLRYLLLVVSQLNEQPGCTKAVRDLPTVPKGSEELIDNDGQIMDCPICMEALAEPGGEVVRPPCKHYFHQECLLTWCKNHVDCPMCRQQVGKPDDEAEPDP